MPPLPQDLETSVTAWEARLDAGIGVAPRGTASDWDITMRPHEWSPKSSPFADRSDDTFRFSSGF